MRRDCAACPWCTMIETAHGNTRYICADEDGGNYMGETGLLGWCNVQGVDNDDPQEDESE